MSDYFRQVAVNTSFLNSESWIILSNIEQSIKDKIELIGTPLKDWNINIYRGLLTGYNEAFIIDDKKKQELIKMDPKSDEIIRPILRGRDIKRYSYNFEDLWIINSHNGYKDSDDNQINRINIEDYPAIKKHLDNYWNHIEKRSDKGYTPYNLRNCAYMEDFSKHKIIYPDIMRMPRKVEQLNTYPYFYLDQNGFFIEATNFMMTGENIDLVYLFLVSDVGFFIFSKFYAGPQFDETGFRYKKAYLDETYIPIPNPDIINMLREIDLNTNKDNITEVNKIWFNCLNLNKTEIDFINQYKKNIIEASLKDEVIPTTE